jgi:tRNA U34 5-carboxymethylaminomethyl modifying enzyme MnmG/GidA
MTELNLLYGDDNLLNDNNIIERKEPTYSSKISSQQIHQLALNNDNEDKQMMHPAQSQSMQITQQQMAQQMAQQQAHQMAQQQIQQHMMQPQQAVNPQNNNEQAYKKRNEYNFIDRMNLKKSEVIKLALFSLVIVLGISVDRMLTYYISKYINDNILTDFQELLLRLSYPITIFLLLWIFKAI